MVCLPPSCRFPRAKLIVKLSACNMNGRPKLGTATGSLNGRNWVPTAEYAVGSKMGIFGGGHHSPPREHRHDKGRLAATVPSIRNGLG